MRGGNIQQRYRLRDEGKGFDLTQTREPRTVDLASQVLVLRHLVSGESH